MTCRSSVLDVNVDGTVGVRDEVGPIADVVPVKWIWHEIIFRVAHGKGPERAVWWEIAGREAQDVVVRSGELLARVVYLRRPVHRLLRYVYRTRKYDGARGAKKNPVIG